MSKMTTAKGTEFPIMDIKGKPYLQVAYRIAWFREEHPDWGIRTSVKLLDDGVSSIGFAEISDTTGRVIATGHKYEDKKGFSDFMEKSETGAIGRALALIGYGTQFTTDLDEGERLVDAPLGEKVKNSFGVVLNSNPRPTNARGDYFINEKQRGLFYHRANAAGLIKTNKVDAQSAWLQKNFHIDRPEQIPYSQFDQILLALKTIKDEPPPFDDGDQLPF